MVTVWKNLLDYAVQSPITVPMKFIRRELWICYEVNMFNGNKNKQNKKYFNESRGENENGRERVKKKDDFVF